jgi:hypothetical protein
MPVDLVECEEGRIVEQVPIKFDPWRAAIFVMLKPLKA